MANPKGNVSTLKHYKPKWNSGKTQTVRVPIALANKVLDYAHKLDSETSQAMTQVNKDEYEEEELEEDEDGEDSDLETIKRQAKKIQSLVSEIHFLKRDLEKAESSYTCSQTLSQVIASIEDVCKSSYKSKFTKVLKDRLYNEAIKPLESLTHVNKG